MAAGADGGRRPPVAPRLTAWAARHGRRGLPWQDPATPYRVWVSEIMLQQTRVATVIPYFERFVKRFPSPDALADATLEDVLARWSGLGYYARARNLHAAARRCRDEHGGRLPAALDELAALPGIGRSTAGAILALAHGIRAPILDGNAKRVLARYHAVPGWPGSASCARELWRLADAETPASGVAAYTQAIMDLGATVCTRRSPACGDCPLSPDCAALAAGLEETLPAPRPARARPLRSARYAWIEDGGGLLLEKRPPAGVWGGMLCLPELPAPETPEEWCRRVLGAAPRSVSELDGFRHEFTHFRLDARVLAVRVGEGRRAADGALRWITPEAALAAGLPAPMKDYIRRRAAAACCNREERT